MLPQRVERIKPACQNFMSITLVAYIPNNCIIFIIKYSVQGNRQFNYTKIACKVSAVFSDNFNNFFSNFAG